jgi:hypothetical protein
MDTFMIVLYLSLTAVFWCAVLHLVNGKWRYEVRFLMSSATALFPLGFVMLLIILASGAKSFPWMGGVTFGEPLNGWHNTIFFDLRQIVLYLAVWGFCSYFCKLQKREYPTAPAADRRRFRNVALLVPFVYCIYGTIIAWDFEMTQIPRWWSPIFGPLHIVSMMYMFMAFFIVALFVLRKRDVLKRPTHDYVFNYCAQIMLAMAISWTYMFFAQYLVVWYGDLPEEIERFNKMMDGPSWFLYWSFFLMKSFVPFLLLLFATVRRSPALLLIPSVSILVGSFLEHYMWIISPYADDIIHTPMLSSWSDVIITFGAFLLCCFLWDRRMKKDGLYRDASAAENVEGSAAA